MSSDYTVYANGDARAIRRVVELYLGIELRELEDTSLGGVWRAEWVQVPVTLDPVHEMEDDMGIAFSRFPVAVAFARSASQHDSDLREDLCRIVATLIGREIYRELGASNVVVKNSQLVVERNPSELLSS